MIDFKWKYSFATQTVCLHYCSLDLFVSLSLRQAHRKSFQTQKSYSQMKHSACSCMPTTAYILCALLKTAYPPTLLWHIVQWASIVNPIHSNINLSAMRRIKNYNSSAILPTYVSQIDFFSQLISSSSLPHILVLFYAACCSYRWHKSNPYSHSRYEMYFFSVCVCVQKGINVHILSAFVCRLCSWTLNHWRNFVAIFVFKLIMCERKRNAQWKNERSFYIYNGN